MERNIEIIQLIMEYLGGEMSDSRREELMCWVEEKEENRLFFERMCSTHSFGEYFRSYEQINPDVAIKHFDRRIKKRTSHVSLRRYWQYAAVICLLLSAGVIAYWLQPKNEPVPSVVSAEITPGCAKAVLLLADGRQVALGENDSLAVNIGKGKSATDAKSRLVYEKNQAEEELQYNELKIPRGGEYQVVLSDGSIVRLNSASSLKYPVVFGKEKREVELTGEAYFEVAKDATPFFVKTAEMTIRVYGTVFNVNAHYREKIQTALIEGKVGITIPGKNQEYIMAPQQLAEYNAHTFKMNICQTDLTSHLGWTKGLFVFDNQTLEDIMKTLSLWYDIDVIFSQQATRHLHFTGSVERYADISFILNALSSSIGVKFYQQGKILTIGY